MKSNPFAWITGVLALLLTIVWWRQGEVRDEITMLRAELAAIPKDARIVPASVQKDTVPGEPAPVTGVSRGEGNEDRILELEHVVNAQADLLEGLMAQFSQINERHRKASARSWGPEQVVGPPDTMTAGDQRTAWAPGVADGGVEWLEAEFAQSADLAKVVVRQTCNPGAITKVVAITESGAEVPIWAGEDPSKGQSLADTPFAVPAGVHARKVKVFLDTSKMVGWEEIDAIQIVGRDGTAQWANSVNASSTYARGSIMADSLFLGESVGGDGGLTLWNVEPQSAFGGRVGAGDAADSVVRDYIRIVPTETGEATSAAKPN